MSSVMAIETPALRGKVLGFPRMSGQPANAPRPRWPSQITQLIFPTNTASTHFCQTVSKCHLRISRCSWPTNGKNPACMACRGRCKFTQGSEGVPGRDLPPPGVAILRGLGGTEEVNAVEECLHCCVTASSTEETRTGCLIRRARRLRLR